MDPHYEVEDFFGLCNKDGYVSCYWDWLGIPAV